ncbi:MAG: BCCT family transporter, partial [Ornithinimicrobium sp.]
MPDEQAPEGGSTQEGSEASKREKVASAGRRTKEMVREVNYPHGIHPALVPGVSIEDQRVRYGTDKVVFGVTAAVIAAFILWGTTNTEGLQSASDTALTWVVNNVGWLFNIFAIVAVVFMLIVGFSRFGKIKLGLDDEKPEYTRASWLAML